MLRLNDVILLVVVFSSMLAGIMLPRFSSFFQHWPLYLMMFLLFFSFLPIKIGAIWDTLKKEGKTVLWLSFLKLIAVPVVVYFLFKVFYPRYALAALLLTGISTGVVAPFISSILNANSFLVLVMVVISSPLVPFTLPVLVKVLVGQSIEIPFLGMMRMLCMVILVPIIMVQVLRHFIPSLLESLMKIRFPVSLLVFAIINLGVFSKYSVFFYQNPGIILEATIVGIVLGCIYVVLGIISMYKAPVNDRIAASISFANMNNVLVIVFSSQFFGPLEPTLAAMYMIPFFVLILPLRIYQRIGASGG